MKLSAAKIDITPDGPEELAGYFGQGQPALGVNNRIAARIAAFDDGRCRLVLVNLEILEIPRAQADTIRAELAELFGTEDDLVVITCTHTHSAPAVRELRGSGRTSRMYLNFLRSQIVACSRRAMQNWTVVSLSSGAAPLCIGVNRRAKRRADRGGADGTQPADDTLRGLVAADEQGNTLAVVLNHACHPVCLGRENRSISGDFCGYACDHLEAQLGHSAVVMFLNGCAGDINPCTGMGRTLEFVVSVGDRVVEAGRRLIDASQPAFGPQVLKSCREMCLLEYEHFEIAGLRKQLAAVEARMATAEPRAKPFLQTLHSYYTDWIDRCVRRICPSHMPVVVQHLRIGPVEMAVMSGEVFFEVGVAIRLRSHRPRLWTVAYAHGGDGYIPVSAAFAEGGYEVDIAHYFYDQPPLRPQAAEKLIHCAAEHLLQC